MEEIVIHHTCGVYLNDSCKTNGVPSDNLQEHIDYNKFWRPGRALFVDGKCVFAGSLPPEQIARWEIKLKGVTANRDTRPYQ